jgi:tetratricopeptide (TPR) repeat protein/DNA-binding winged helix-turn-helix (wHTH) protein
MASNSTLSANLIRFGDEFELDSGVYELRRAGRSIRLGRIPMELLLLLAEHRGQLVTREQIVERIWGKDVFLDTDNSINAAIRKIRQTLDDDPEQARFVQTVIGRGYRFIATVKEEEPPFATASSPVAQRFENPVIEKGSRHRTWQILGVTAIALIIVVTLLLSMNITDMRALTFGQAASLASLIPHQARPSVAVLGFKNLSGKEDEAWISTALSELLSVDLAAGQQLRLIPGEDVARMKVDLALPAADTYSESTLIKVRNHLGSNIVVLGSYLTVGKSGDKKIRINLQVQDTKTAETIAAVSEDGAEADLAELVSKSGDRLRTILHVSDVTANDAVHVRATLPTNSKAARLYAEALERLRSFDALTARDLLLQAITVDPNHALSHALLSECWSDLGYDLKAQEEGKKAVDLSSRLSREEQLAIEGRYRVATREWPRAIEIYRMLWEFFPDNPDYGLELVDVQVSARLGKDAMATVEKLSKSSLPGAGDPRIDLATARAAETIGDFKRMQQLAATAADKGRGRSAGLVIAEAKLLEGVSFDRMGDEARATAALEDAEAAFAKAGDLQGKSKSVLEVGNVLYDKGDFSGARAKFEESLAIFRRLGAKRNMARAISDIGNVFYDQGKLSEAQAQYQQALALDREIGFKAKIAGDLGNIANVLDSLGRLNDARKMQEEALAAYSDAGDKNGAAITLNNLGNLLDELGDLPGATESFERAAKLHQETGHKRGLGFVLSGLGLVLLEQDRLTEARSKLEDAVALRKELREQSTLAVSQLYLAQSLLEENRAAEAEKLARDAAAQFAKDKSAENETAAQATLVRALLTQEKLREARAAADQATELSHNTSCLCSRFEASIASALVAGAAGNVAEARRRLDEVIAETGKLGFVGYKLKARLDRGLLELRSGKVGTGHHTYLDSVQKEAAAKGYRLIARKAAV